jgi:hypothetical protein
LASSRLRRAAASFVAISPVTSSPGSSLSAFSRSATASAKCASASRAAARRSRHLIAVGWFGFSRKKLGELVRAVAVLDGLRETPELERRHRRVTVQLDRPLIALQTVLVRLERLRELTGFERGVPGFARAVRGLSLLRFAARAVCRYRLPSP